MFVHIVRVGEIGAKGRRPLPRVLTNVAFYRARARRDFCDSISRNRIVLTGGQFPPAASFRANSQGPLALG